MRSSFRHPVLLSPLARISFGTLVLLAFSLFFAGDVFSAAQEAPSSSTEENSILKEVKTWIVFLGPIILAGVAFLVAAGLDIYTASRLKKTVRRHVMASTIIKLAGGGFVLLYIVLSPDELPADISAKKAAMMAVILNIVGVFLGLGLACHALVVPYWYKWWALYLLGVVIARKAEVPGFLIFLPSVFLFGFTFLRAMNDGTLRFVDKLFPGFAVAWEEEEDSRLILSQQAGGVVEGGDRASSELKTRKKSSRKKAKRKSGKKPAAKETKKKRSSRKKPAKKRPRK